MTRGPYGVSSKPAIFLAAYRALLTATLAFDVIPEEEKEQGGILKLVQGKATNHIQAGKRWYLTCFRSCFSTGCGGQRIGGREHASIIMAVDSR